MPDYQVSGGGLRGYLGKIRSDWGRKQPKTCVWVSAVGGKAFLQRSQPVQSAKVPLHNDQGDSNV